MSEFNYPMQPLYVDDSGVIRFIPNNTLCLMLSGRQKFTVTSEIFRHPDTGKDKLQIMMLMGVSVEQALNHPAATQDFKNQLNAQIDKIMKDKSDFDKRRAIKAERFFNNEH